MKFTITIILFIIANTVISQTNNKDAYRLIGYKNTDNTIISVSNTVESTKKLRIHVPNAFSPDGDGINDLFTTVSDGVEDYMINVYNRWGEVVFYSEDIIESWDGEFNGKLSMQDAYVYVIEARGIEDDKVTIFKGTVSLIR